MSPMAKRLQAWFPEELLKQIAARGSDFSDSIRESLTRYYTLLNYERAQMKDRFTRGELGLILDVCNGTLCTGGMIPLGVAANCEDAEAERYEYWQCDKTELLGKLNKLTTIQEAALVDAIERWWQATGHGFQLDIEQLLVTE